MPLRGPVVAEDVFHDLLRVTEDVDPSPREGSQLDFEDDETALTMEPAESIDEESRVDMNDLEDGDPGGGLEEVYYDSTT